MTILYEQPNGITDEMVNTLGGGPEVDNHTQELKDVWDLKRQVVVISTSDVHPGPLELQCMLIHRSVQHYLARGKIGFKADSAPSLGEDILPSTGVIQIDRALYFVSDIIKRRIPHCTTLAHLILCGC